MKNSNVTPIIQTTCHSQELLSGMPNTINRHAEEFLLSIPTLLTKQGRDPEQQPLRMTYGWNRSAFTLIELLVVVLIIGILAAVALPQYQKAVEKSRIAEAKLVLNTLEKNYQLCFLQGKDDETDCAYPIFIDGDIAFGNHAIDSSEQAPCSEVGGEAPCIINLNWVYYQERGSYGYLRAKRLNKDYTLSKLIRQYSSIVYNQPITCSGTECRSICGSNNCTIK